MPIRAAHVVPQTGTFVDYCARLAMVGVAAKLPPSARCRFTRWIRRSALHPHQRDLRRIKRELVLLDAAQVARADAIAHARKVEATRIVAHRAGEDRLAVGEREAIRQRILDLRESARDAPFRGDDVGRALLNTQVGVVDDRFVNAMRIRSPVQRKYALVQLEAQVLL